MSQIRKGAWDEEMSQIRKGAWDEEEDRRLYELCSTKYGAGNWSLIANHFKTRTAKQCRERWTNHISPNVDKSPFSREEQDKIMSLYKSEGPKWAEIARNLGPRRTPLGVRNWWKTHHNSQDAAAATNSQQQTETRSEKMEFNYILNSHQPEE